MPRPVARSALAILVLGCLAPVAPAHEVRRHRHHPIRHRPAARAVDPHAAYGSRVDPTPTCRYPDGTPYDPDIIGGPNHVGDGGPAGNLGGSDPCGY